MIQIYNELYTALRNAVKNAYPNAETGRAYSSSVTTFPYLAVSQIDNSTYERTSDSGNIENHATIAFQLDVYSNKASTASTECENIMAVADAVMLEKGFIRTMWQETPNITPTISRLTTRYRGVVGTDKTVYRR
jgi:hypothetical protein